MRYLVKIGELGSKIDYLEKQLSYIDENIDNLKKIKNSIIWEGTASASFFNKYDEYIMELTTIENNTLELLKYLMAYYDKYGTKYAILSRKYAKLDEGDK